MKKIIKNDAVATETVAAPATNAAAATAEEVKVKEPSKMSKGKAIFFAELANRKNGKFASNKAFRRCVRERMVAECEISWASSGSIFNAAKKEAEVEAAKTGEDLKLGRDPKKEKAAKEPGKRGRPVGSKNKPKEEATATPATTEGAAVAGDTQAALVIEVQTETTTEQVVQEPATESVQQEADPV